LIGEKGEIKKNTFLYKGRRTKTRILLLHIKKITVFLVLFLVFATEAVEGIQILEELLVIVISVKEVVKGDDAVHVLVNDLHELVGLLLDVSLLVRSQLDLLLAGLLTTLLKDGTLKNLAERLLGELASALAVSKGERGSELGLLISNTNTHEKKELSEIHLAGLLAAAQTPDVLVHFTLIFVTFTFLIKEAIPVHLVDNLLGVVLTHLLEGKLDLVIRLSVEAKTHVCRACKIVLVKRRKHTVLCTHFQLTKKGTFFCI